MDNPFRGLCNGIWTGLLLWAVIGLAVWQCTRAMG